VIGNQPCEFASLTTGNNFSDANRGATYVFSDLSNTYPYDGSVTAIDFELGWLTDAPPSSVCHVELAVRTEKVAVEVSAPELKTVAYWKISLKRPTKFVAKYAFPRPLN